MSTSGPRRINATDTEQDRFSDTLETYTSLVNDLLAESDVADDEDMATVRRVSSELVDEATEIEARVESNEKAVSETQELVADTRREQADVRSDVHEVKQAVKSHDDGEIEPAGGGSSPSDPEGMTTEDGEDGTTQTAPSPQTALEDTIRLPEPVASDTLTANEQRARSVARDLGDYCDYNHQYGTYSLTASTLRKVLTAQSDADGSVHAQTVKRVRQFLTRLGEDSVSVVEDTGGTRRITFAESLVDRIESWVEAHGGVTAEMVGTGARS